MSSRDSDNYFDSPNISHLNSQTYSKSEVSVTDDVILSGTNTKLNHPHSSTGDIIAQEENFPEVKYLNTNYPSTMDQIHNDESLLDPITASRLSGSLNELGELEGAKTSVWSSTFESNPNNLALQTDTIFATSTDLLLSESRLQPSEISRVNIVATINDQRLSTPEKGTFDTGFYESEANLMANVSSAVGQIQDDKTFFNPITANRLAGSMNEFGELEDAKTAFWSSNFESDSHDLAWQIDAKIATSTDLLLSESKLQSSDVSQVNIAATLTEQRLNDPERVLSDAAMLRVGVATDLGATATDFSTSSFSNELAVGPIGSKDFFPSGNQTYPINIIEEKLSEFATSLKNEDISCHFGVDYTQYKGGPNLEINIYIVGDVTGDKHQFGDIIYKLN